MHHHATLFALTLLATLTLDAAAGSPKAENPPGIVRQPIARSATVGGHATLSVIAQGQGLTFRWFRNDEAVSDGGPLSGATGPVLNFDPVLATNSGQYAVVVTSGSLSVTSAVVTLNVNNIGFNSVPTGATGAVVTLTGQVGDVYRVELSSNFGPWLTNAYATNFSGQARATVRWNNDGTFKNLRVAVDHMLPVLYPGPRATPGHVSAYGKLNQTWRWQASQDFSHWDDLGTTVNSTGWVFIDDVAEPRPAYRFYRIVPP